MLLPCPTCKTSVRFELEGSWMRVCGNCGAMVSHGGRPLAGNIVPMRILEDLSPFRTGTTGKFEGKDFRITGRIRVEGALGYRNFWSVRGADLPYRWLMQSYGNYAFLHKRREPLQKHGLSGRKPGGVVQVAEGQTHIIELMDNTFRYAWEGELMDPMLLPYSIEIEAGRAPADKAIIHVGDGAKEIECLEGVMVDFPDLGIEPSSALARWT